MKYNQVTPLRNKQNKRKITQSNKRSRTNTSKIVTALLKTHEHKFIDTYATAVAITGAGSAVPFNNIVEGNDNNQRIGRKVRGLYIMYDIQIQPLTTGSTLINDSYIWHIVCDRQANAATAVYSLPFDVTVANQSVAFKTMSASERFQILKSQECWTSAANSTQSPSISSELRWRGYLPYTEDSQFKDTTALPPNTNSLVLYFAANGNAEATIQYNLRYVFIDL